MAKEEPGRLLSKVAKFVRNPLKDWSELDAQDSAAPDNGYSREMLKEMIERRQRNDFVRRREFDMLRKLRRRDAAGGRDDGGTPSQFNVSSTSGKTEGRALTLKKIDEIEEQMSQQWWKSRGPASDGAAALPVPGSGPEVPADMAGEHVRAYADTVPGVTPHVSAQGDSASGGRSSDDDASHAGRQVYESGIEEAAIRFAQSDDAGAEAILLQTLAPDSAQAEQNDSWLALLDLYRATGDSEKFVAANTRYAQRFKRQGPEWVSLRSLARDLQVAASVAQNSADADRPLGVADWFAPAVLTRPSLGELTRALAAATGPKWTLDWRALRNIDEEAAAPLKALLAHWADSAVQIQFVGMGHLTAVLEQATPSNERTVDAIWWQLRMEALRVMHAADDFELVALNYCITYEVSPPPWTDPKGEFASIEVVTEAPKPQKPAAPSLTLASMSDEVPVDIGPKLPSLIGELTGESAAVWQRLDAELADAVAPTISCAALVRIDFAAAGTLLNWVTARDARGQRVQFVDAHRLVTAFFGVIGIADHAAVSPRQH
ncbi:ABC-type transporter Mla MlaB component [Variovorax sp. GrIS 2.14]|uniref:STAS domain-containing protein n=1 Tax=Variovorax sp. GrIS 2.14 TaxID=3071709 RepID=UPI0038F72C87